MDADTLLQKTVGRLRAHEGQYAEIARQNEHISYSWLTKLAHGQITNPTVSSLQQLIDALDQHEGVVRVAPAAAAAAVTATVDVTPEQEDPDQRRIVPLEEA